MTKGELPNFNAKQKLLHGKDQSAETQSLVGRQFLEAGQLYDALEFFDRARDQQGIDRLRERAVLESDPLLLKLVLRRLAGEAAAGEWRQLGDNALQAGKRLCAEEAFRMAGDWQAVARLRGEAAAEERAAAGAEAPGDDAEAEDGTGDDEDGAGGDGDGS